MGKFIGYGDVRKSVRLGIIVMAFFTQGNIVVMGLLFEVYWVGNDGSYIAIEPLDYLT